MDDDGRLAGHRAGMTKFYAFKFNQGTGSSLSALIFGNWFRKQIKASGLANKCSAHGLRKAAARRLAKPGARRDRFWKCEAAVTGHKSLRED